MFCPNFRTRILESRLATGSLDPCHRHFLSPNHGQTVHAGASRAGGHQRRLRDGSVPSACGKSIPGWNPPGRDRRCVAGAAWGWRWAALAPDTALACRGIPPRERPVREDLGDKVVARTHPAPPEGEDSAEMVRTRCLRHNIPCGCRPAPPPTIGQSGTMRARHIVAAKYPDICD